MADRPILFSAPMVRALLAGTKTQTRRLLKPQPPEGATFFAWDIGPYGNFAAFMTERNANADLHPSRLPAWRGDRLWVREAHYLTDDGDNEYALFPADEAAEIAEHLEQIARLQRDHPNPEHWAKHKRLRSSIHMPRWASRLTLTVTEVRVQRLQEISEADALAEGVTATDRSTARGVYSRLWESLHGHDAWEANPWVVAVSFDVRKGNIDA